MISILYVIAAVCLVGACAFKADRMSPATFPFFKAALVLFAIGGSGELYLLAAYPALPLEFKLVSLILSGGAALWLVHERRIT